MRVIGALLLAVAVACGHGAVRSAVLTPGHSAHTPGRLAVRRLRGGAKMAGTKGSGEDAVDEMVRPDASDEVRISTKVLPHQLTVEDTLDDDDDSVCSLHPSKLTELGLMAGDSVRLKGKRDRETLCTVAEEKRVPEGACALSAVARHNLRLELGEQLKIYQCDPRPATRIVLSPYSDSVGGMDNEEVLDQVVRPHLVGADDTAFRPLHIGDTLRILHGPTQVELKVTAIEPEGERRCLVTPETELEVEDEIDRAAEEALEVGKVGYDDVGGCDKQLAKIRELVELPMKHPKVFTSIGVAPPRGVLIHGPPGCGKTMIAKAVAYETGAFFFVINGPEVMSKQGGESEQNLRRAFEECEANAPAVLFIDEIDSIAPRRDKTQGEAERRIVSQLITLMDSLTAKSQVVVMAATNRPNTIDPALRRFGRFDLEINIPVPDEPGRLDILRTKCKKLRLSSDVDLVALAHDTQGYVGADLAQLIFESALLCVRDLLPKVDLEMERLPREVLDELLVTPEYVSKALSLTNPSSLRETAIEVPNVKWEDIGGLEDVKRELKETVQYPVQYADKFEFFGMSPSKGVLFYGPPGCGKTLLAKAIANECKANFISVKGPELLTMWFGESEANVRDLFQKARQASPCVIFFDEMDSIAKARGSGGGGASEAGDRVINQILTEIDGVGARKSVFVIGATNRPDILDPAVMRPGRLDQLIYIPVPDYESRLSIFKANLRKSPLADDVDLAHLANITNDFSGADITEICQRACKLAIRYEIADQEKAESEAEAAGKPPPEPKLDGKLTAAHFAESMQNARRSISKKELARYLKFRKDLSASPTNPRAALEGGNEEGGAAKGGPPPPAAPEIDDETSNEDLYA